MRCVEVEERLTAYVDRELEPALEQLVREHLYGCVTCREELASLRAIDAEIQALPQVGMSAEFAEAVTARVCKDFLARDGSPVGRTGPFGRLANLLEAFFELLEAPGSPRTRTLEEFSDFPPLSMGYVYCRLLGLCTGD
jgi:anti-sigma factor RsiW